MRLLLLLILFLLLLFLLLILLLFILLLLIISFLLLLFRYRKSSTRRDARGRKYEKETPLPTPTYKRNKWERGRGGREGAGWSEGGRWVSRFSFLILK